MHKVVLVLTPLCYASHGRRLHTTPAQSQSSLYLDTQKLLKDTKSPLLGSLNLFATLLLAFSPAAGFNPTGLKLHYHVDTAVLEDRTRSSNNGLRPTVLCRRDWHDHHVPMLNKMERAARSPSCGEHSVASLRLGASPCMRLPNAYRYLEEEDEEEVGEKQEEEAGEGPSFKNASTQLDRFFFDRADLFVRSGAGGKGAIGYVGSRAAGGNGGKGGSVYLEGSTQYNTLAHLQDRGGSAHADKGQDASHRQSGSAGEHKIVPVPLNTAVHERDTNILLGKLTYPGERLLVAEGGEGGAGNSMGENMYKKVGPPGGTQRQWLTLSMTLIADVGLVGMPNAGKSTLLRAVSSARPKVADYPFTTLIPNLGVCLMERFDLRCDSMVWLDIPGVIEGAAEGKGLGLAFLRHAERCRLILHLVDGSFDDPVARLRTINKELTNFSPHLRSIPQVVLLTKTDLPEVAETLEAKMEALKSEVRHGRVLSISSHTQSNLRELLLRMRRLIDKVKKTEAAYAADSDEGESS